MQQIKDIITFENDKISLCNRYRSCSDCTDVYCNSCCSIKHLSFFKKIYHSYDGCGFSYYDKNKIVKFDKYVGLLQLQDGTYVEILPKIINTKSEKTIGENEINNGRKIFENLMKASLNITREYKETANTNINVGKKLPLFEIYVSVFCAGLSDILQNGIKKSYITKADNLNIYKGKLKLSEHIKNNIISMNKFFVEYDEFCDDIAENRIIKAACKYLLPKSSDNENKKILRKIIFEMNNVSELVNLESDLQKVQINRLNYYYEQPLKFAEFFLKQNHFMPQKGQNKMPSLLFPLNKMFEDYIESLLKDFNFNYRKQHSSLYLANNSNENLFNMQMDFVILDKQLVLDAKWKMIMLPEQVNFGVNQNDLYQLYAYAKRLSYRYNKEFKVILIYPETEFFKEKVELNYFDNTKVTLMPVDVLDKKQNEYFKVYLDSVS